MAITDQRDLIADATDTAGWTDNSGAGSPATNIETAPPGVTTVISDKVSNDLDGLIFDDGGTSTFADGDTIYIWWSTIFGPLNTVANGGVRAYFAGATITDFFSVIIGGSDAGVSGWQLTAINIGKARANPDFVGGSPPTAANIEQIGVEWDMTSTVGGNNDNVAIGNIYRQTDAERTYRVDAGTDGTPNTWQDVADQVLTDGTGIVTAEANGTFTLKGSIAFGPSSGDVDTTFDDSNVVLAFENYDLIADDFYALEMDLPASYSGDARLTAGARSGSGDSSSGVGGWTIVTGGNRYQMNFDDTDATDAQFFGCSFQGSGKWEVADTAVEIRSCVFTDCDTLRHNNACTVVKNFFSAAPGPGAQVDLEDDPAAADFFENTFVNMLWWAIEISESATTTYVLRGVSFSGNGTDRDILLSNNSGALTLSVVDSPNGVSGSVPGVTNGATITITAVGACDQLAVTAVTYDNVNETTPTPETNSATGTGTLTAGVTPDNADSYAIAAYANDDFGSVDWSGSSAYVEEVDARDLETLSLLSAASKTGVTGLQTASAAPITAPTTGALAVAEVDSEAASAVLQVDPAWRPVEGTPASATHVFGYGATHDEDSPSTSLAAFVAIQSLDVVTAGDSAISTVSWGGTNMVSVVSADDSANGVRTSIFELRGTDLRKGTFAVEANVTIEIFGVTEGSRVVIQRTDTDEELLNALAFTADGQGTFKASATFNYASDTAVRVSAAASGKVVAALAEDQSEGTPFTDETLEANDSRTGEGMTLVPIIAAPAIGDAYYMGHTEQFTRLDIDVTTAGVGAYTLATEYWNGTVWGAVSGETDDTNDFKNAGTNRISWTVPGDQATRTVTNQPGATALYYVRFRVTATGFTTDPVGNTAKLDVTLYERWEDAATIVSTGLSAKATWIPDTIAQF